MDNSMPTNLMAQMKWTNSVKNTNTKTHIKRSNQNQPVSIKEIELIIYNLPKKKATGG